MTEAGTGGNSVVYYARVIKRRGWILVITVALGIGLALLLTARQHPSYRASADVKVNTQSFSDGQSTDISKDPTRIIATQAALANSEQVAGEGVTCAKRLYGAQVVAAANGNADPQFDCKLGTAPPSPGKPLTADQKLVASWERAGAGLFRDAKMRPWNADDLMANSSIAADPDTDIVHFAVTAPDKTVAMWLADGYAVAFADSSVRTAQEQIDKALIVPKAQAKTDTQKIAALQAQITNRLNAGLDVSDLQAQVGAYSGELQTAIGLIQVLETQKLTLPGASQLSNPADPGTPAGPSLKRNLVAGGIFGMVLGLGLIFLLEALDRKVRSSQEVGAMLGMNVLARIPAPPRSLRRQDHIAMMAPGTGRGHVEAYRKLRVALDFANLQAKARVIMVTSAVEQEGKSTTVANLAVALAQVGRHVVLVDLDLRRPYLNRFFDIDQTPGFTDVALGHAPLSQVLHKIAITPSGSSNGTLNSARSNGNGHHEPGRVEGLLEVLTAGSQPPDPAAFLESEAVGDVMSVLRQHADVVLVDAPPVLPVSDALAISTRVDGIVIVSRLEVVQKPMLRELRAELDRVHVPRVGLVLTGAESDNAYGYGYGYGYGYEAGGVRSDPADYRPPAATSRDN